MPTILSREASIGTGLAVAALVWGVFNSAMPSVADVRVGQPHDKDLSATERTATAASAAVVAGISLLTKDPTVFVLGGTMVVVLSWWHRHANHYDPAVGSAVIPSSRDALTYTPSSASVDAYAPA